MEIFNGGLIMTKKLVALFLAAAMFCSFGTMAFASEADPESENTRRLAIIDALNYVEFDKNNFGLENVNFNNLGIGAAIHAYEYTDIGFEEIIQFYPLFDGTHLVALAICVDGEHYQIETALANAIAEIGAANAAIVYDLGHCYLYDGIDFINIADTSILIDGRAVLPEENNLARVYNLKVTNICPSDALNYTSLQAARAGTYYSCNVRYITQSPYNQLCWAACCAMIANCVNETTIYTTESISRRYFNSTTVVNLGVAADDCAIFMQNRLGLDYTYNGCVPSDNAILINIRNGYPIYASCDWYRSDSNGSHAVVVYGVNPTSAYVSLMDPEFGSTSAHRSGSTYSYYSSVAGTDIIWARSNCYTW